MRGESFELGWLQRLVGALVWLFAIACLAVIFAIVIGALGWALSAADGDERRAQLHRWLAGGLAALAVFQLGLAALWRRLRARVTVLDDGIVLHGVLSERLVAVDELRDAYVENVGSAPEAAGTLQLELEDGRRLRRPHVPRAAALREALGRELMPALARRLRRRLREGEQLEVARRSSLWGWSALAAGAGLLALLGSASISGEFSGLRTWLRDPARLLDGCVGVAAAVGTLVYGWQRVQLARHPAVTADREGLRRHDDGSLLPWGALRKVETSVESAWFEGDASDSGGAQLRLSRDLPRVELLVALGQLELAEGPDAEPSEESEPT